MRVVIDTDAVTMVVEEDGAPRALPLDGPEALEVVSDLWVRLGWNRGYSYTFTWLGRPVIQLPEDLVRLQEVVWALRPDVIVETGIAHGGSAVFLAGLCELAGRGRVIAVDVEIRPHNRSAIESHPLAHRITLVEGDSVAPDVVAGISEQVGDAETVLVVLDSDHSREHVLAELEAYAPLVTAGSWIVATDGVMQDVADLPRGRPEWRHDNPVAAVGRFLATHPEFALDPPARAFDESDGANSTTYWPEAWLRRRSDGDRT